MFSSPGLVQFGNSYTLDSVSSVRFPSPLKSVVMLVATQSFLLAIIFTSLRLKINVCKVTTDYCPSL